MAIFKEIAVVDAADSVIFDPASFTVDRIRGESEYGGVRIKGNSTVDNACVRVAIDIAFGDAIEPSVQETDLPVLLVKGDALARAMEEIRHSWRSGSRSSKDVD